MAFAHTAIRLIEVTDAPAIASHLARDAKEFSRWDPARPEEFYTTPGQELRIEKLLYGYLNGTGWPGVILAGGEVIGQVTISGIVRGPFQKCSLGYWVGSTFHNLGHASRAVGLVLQVMTQELQLHRVEASTQTENLASQKVLKNNGFTTWGVAHSHIYINKAWRDGLFWEKTLSDANPSK